FEAPEPVQGETETVSGPAIERRRNCASREACEYVARSGRVTQAQRGPPAARKRPDRERLARLLRDLPEEAIRLIRTSDDVERLREPVPCLGDQLTLGAALHRLLERFTRLLVLAAIETPHAALEVLRRAREPGPEARRRAGRRHGGRRLLDGRHGDRGGTHWWKLRGRWRQRRQRGRNRRLLEGCHRNRHERGDVGRRGGERQRRRGDEREPDEREHDNAHDHVLPFGFPASAGLAGDFTSRAFTVFTRSCAHSRSPASGLLPATASYAAS